MQETISNFVDQNSSFSGLNKYEGYHNGEIFFDLKLWFGSNDSLNNTIKELAEQYSPQIYSSRTMWKNKVDAVIAVLLNLLVGYLNGAQVVISLNSNYYSRTKNAKVPKYLSARNVLRTVKWLEETKKIEKTSKYYYFRDCGDYKKGQGMLPTIELTKDAIDQISREYSKLVEQTASLLPFEQTEYRLEPINYFGERNTSQIIEIRSGAKKSIASKKTSKIRRMENFLKKYNKFIEETKISLALPKGEIFELEKEEGKKRKKNRDHNFIKLITRVRANLILPLLLTQNKEIEDSKGYDKTKRSDTKDIIPLDITKQGNDLINIELRGRLKRVFNNSTIKNGGRLYGADYQVIKKTLRHKYLKINGNAVVEFDFSSLHLMMCYHKEKIDYQGAAYTPEGIPQELRSAMKVLSLMCVNADTKEKAKLAFKNEVDTVTLNLIRKNGLTINKMVKIFEKTHKAISKYFYSGEGIRLQALDSEIAEKIMKHFLKRKIPVLCMHDSFIVEEQYKEELYRIMKEKYKEVMGFDIKVEVK